MDASLLKRWVVGKPMPLAQARHERLSKTVALAVFSSDALSSVAYATEEILLVLVLAGAAAAHLLVPVAVAITALLLVVVVSYQQTIHAYPSGGGSYIVARANLGATPGLIAAGALLIDYVLTVSVSVAAGVAALTSALPGLHAHRVALRLEFLRGLGGDGHARLARRSFQRNTDQHGSLLANDFVMGGSRGSHATAAIAEQGRPGFRA